ncbi:MAG: thiol-disulfide isomerase/thioredoxin [Gammaproteobacteria bacterium]|jgi:thiol-disulfide isomerase/thioredoxin
MLGGLALFKKNYSRPRSVLVSRLWRTMATKVRKVTTVACLSCALIVISSVLPSHAGKGHALLDNPAPEFSHRAQSDWFNSQPLSLKDLRGQAVLVEFWTYGCHNCFRSIARLKKLQERFADRPVHIVAVHTPEFDHERDHAKIAAKIEEFGLTYPVMVDNDYSYWKAMRNRFWPTFFLIDKYGVVRNVYETHVGDSQSRKMATSLSRLAKEDYGEPE